MPRERMGAIMPGTGIHHVTIICGPARRNVDFYTKVLGLRLVKKTVNFDDPLVYHFYYGDAEGSPGTIITFFPWEGEEAGRLGAGEALETTYRIPAGAIGYWARRLIEKGVPHEPPTSRFGDPILTFRDPDGVRLALVGIRGAETEACFVGSDVPQDCALRGFHGVTLIEREVEPTADILTDVLGFRRIAQEGAFTRFRVDDIAMGGVVDIYAVGEVQKGRMGAGSIHHVAFRAADDEAQAEMGRRLVERHSLAVTQQKDRKYFRSTYFSEPGGVRFEIATDVPGFAVDEPRDKLGEALKLPAFLEPRRAEIEGVLPAL